VIGRLVGSLAGRLVVGVAYVAGLVLLIPLVVVRMFPAEAHLVPAGTSPLLAWVAAGLVLLALVVQLGRSSSVGAALVGLGWLTFLPGAVGLIASLLGRDTLLDTLAGLLPQRPEARSLGELYLDTAVPRVRYLAVGFFVLGLLLLLAGSRLRAGRARSG
jgi:hypothetical protein